MEKLRLLLYGLGLQRFRLQAKQRKKRYLDPKRLALYAEALNAKAVQQDLVLQQVLEKLNTLDNAVTRALALPQNNPTCPHILSSFELTLEHQKEMNVFKGPNIAIGTVENLIVNYGNNHEQSEVKNDDSEEKEYHTEHHHQSPFNPPQTQAVIFLPPDVNPQREIIIPDVINTPQGLELLKRAQDMNWLDENYMPKDLSHTKAAVLAFDISRELGLKNQWKLFSSFWNIPNLGVYYNRSLEQRWFPDFDKNVTSVLSSREL